MSNQNPANYRPPTDEGASALRQSILLHVLGLDAGLPYWPSMNLGIRPAQQESLQIAALWACKELKDSQIFLASRQEFGNRVKSIFDSFTKDLENELGTAEAEEVRLWIDWDFCGLSTDESVEFGWMLAFIELRNEYPTPKICFAFERKRYAWLVEKIEAQIIKKRIERLKDFPQAPSSERDKEICHRWESFGREPESLRSKEKKCYLLGCIERTFTVAHIRNFWNDLTTLLTDQESQALLDWYQRKDEESLKKFPWLRNTPMKPRTPLWMPET